MTGADVPFNKIVLVGEPAVGKTSIRRQYMGKSFKTKYIATIGTELSFYESDKMNLSIWDLAGENNYAVIRKTFYTGAYGIIAVFDLTRPNTIEDLTNWFAEFRNILHQDVPVVITGNKIDLKDEEGYQIVSDDTFKAFIERNKDTINLHDQSLYTSAKTGENISQLFDVLIDKINSFTKKYSL